MAIQAPLRPRSGGRAPVVTAELLLPVLPVVSGLQLLRLLVSTVVGVYRDRLGAPTANLALFAGCAVALGFLAAPAARLLGRPRALVVSAAGVALVRLALPWRGWSSRGYGGPGLTWSWSRSGRSCCWPRPWPG